MTVHGARRRSRPRRGRRWLLPASMLVLGLIIGAVAVAVLKPNSDLLGSSPGSAVGPTPTATSGPDVTTGPGRPGSSGTATATVPAACAALVADARRAAQLLDQAATAARDLDAARMADIARQMQDARDALSAQSTACSTASVSAGNPSPST